MKKTCFVIMPFKEELNGTYQTIKDVCINLEIECRRADEVAMGSIAKSIFEQIYCSDFIVADLTYSNPNVFYEIAISHTIGRKTILISRDEKIPFDISQDHVIRYTDTVNGASLLTKELKGKIERLNNGEFIDNPAQRYLPKSQQEIKLDAFTDINKEILVALIESRKVEIEIMVKSAILSLRDPAFEKSVKQDLEKLNSLIDKIGKN